MKVNPLVVKMPNGLKVTDIDLLRFLTGQSPKSYFGRDGHPLVLIEPIAQKLKSASPEDRAKLEVQCGDWDEAVETIISALLILGIRQQKSDGRSLGEAPMLEAMFARAFGIHE